MLWKPSLIIGVIWTCIEFTYQSHMEKLTWDASATNMLREKENIRQTGMGVELAVTSTTSRLADLRREMSSTGIDTYIVPSGDEHLNIYLAPRYKRREWISGFTGTTGTAVITMTQAALWTDARYYQQAENQIDSNWVLMKDGLPSTPSIEEWIVQTATGTSTISANPYLFSITRWKYFEEYFKSNGHVFKQSIPDLVDNVWYDRPGTSGTEIVIYPITYSGQNWTSKISAARSRMREEGADYLLLTLLDEIAWTFNLRGNDIPYTPVFTSYSIIGLNEAKIYLNISQGQTLKVKDQLRPQGCESQGTCVDIYDYERARDDILALDRTKKVWMSPTSTTYGMYSAVEEDRQIQIESPIKFAKAVKNDIERESMKQAHVYDAIGLIEYMIWLEENVPKGTVTEQSGFVKLEEFRRSQPQSKGPSFEAISASGPNAAQIHYGTSTGNNRNLSTQEIYLIDSGGHYLEGTTDVSRTIHFGDPTEFQKETFTRVLMGIMDTETAIFPSSRDGNDIGILARHSLYEVGLDYPHGTGHGVGQYLGTHEYPPGIGTAAAEGYSFQIGMFTTIEPGYYQKDEFGIRLENVAMVTAANTEYKYGEYAYLTFEAVTLVPFQTKMINLDLLSDFQLDYLNSYHAKIFQVVGDEARNQKKDNVYSWLEKATAPVYRNFAIALRGNHLLAYLLCCWIYKVIMI